MKKYLNMIFEKFNSNYNSILTISVLNSSFFAKKHLKNSYILKLLFLPFFLIFAFFKHDWKNSVIVSCFDIVDTERCNLKCDGCASLMHYYENPKDVPTSQLIHDFSSFLDVIDFVNLINLIGGEPFLNRNLHEVLVFLFESDYKDKFNRLNIITNGTVIPDKLTIKVMSKYRDKIFIDISNYGLKIDKLMKIFKENNIPHKLKEDETVWMVSGDLSKQNMDKDTIRSLYSKCSYKIYCNTIFRGRYYICPRQAHGTNLKKIPDDNNYIDLNLPYEERLNKFKELKNLDYIEACDYCTMGWDIEYCKTVDVNNFKS
jgi:organic radical activating enzyme